MKKKTTLTKMHIAPSTVRYDAVAARDSNEVGQILAGTRKRNGYSLVAFSELLRHYGVDVSDKGISKWEKGYTTPSIYQLVAICYALNIKEGPSYFTKNFQKPALLNDIGQKKVAEYEMDLIASRRYQPDAEEPAEIDYIMMPVSELPVSAGLGAFLEGEMFQQMESIKWKCQRSRISQSSADCPMRKSESLHREETCKYDATGSDDMCNCCICMVHFWV